MRTTTAFFAGAGTIAVALAAGLGGGLLISNIVSPHAPKQGAELSKVERRTTDPVPAANAAFESSSYIEATQAAATKPVTVSPAPQALSQEARQQQAQPQTQQANAAPVSNPQPAATSTQTAAREHPQPLTMRSPGRAILTSNASCAVPRNSARPNAASNGWRSAATAVAGMTSFAMSN